MQCTVTVRVLGEMQSNCYILRGEQNPNACVLIDIGDGASTILSYLEKNDLTPKAVLLTHGHYDHIAGVAEVIAKYPAPVYIHTADFSMLQDSRTNLADYLTQKPFHPIQDALTMEDGDVLTFDDITLHVLHTPGHTKGSVCFLGEDVLFTGDTLFRLSRGRTDFPGGSDQEMLASFRKLAALEGDYTVYPGHGNASTLFYEKMHNPTFTYQS